MSLTPDNLERGRGLWEEARRAQDGSALNALRAWAQECRCAEAERLLAKALLQVAVNRMVSWAGENLKRLSTLSSEARGQMELALELDVVLLFNEALSAATRGACEHNSLQCFYLACLLAHAARGRANTMHVIARISVLRQLDAKLAEWRKAGTRQPW